MFPVIPLKGLKLHQLGPRDLVSCYSVIPLLAVINFRIKKKTHIIKPFIINLDAIKPSLGRILLQFCSLAFLALLEYLPGSAATRTARLNTATTYST